MTGSSDDAFKKLLEGQGARGTDAVVVQLYQRPTMQHKCHLPGPKAASVTAVLPEDPLLFLSFSERNIVHLFYSPTVGVSTLVGGSAPYLWRHSTEPWPIHNQTTSTCH